MRSLNGNVGGGNGSTSITARIADLGRALETAADLARVVQESLEAQRLLTSMDTMYTVVRDLERLQGRVENVPEEVEADIEEKYAEPVYCPAMVGTASLSLAALSVLNGGGR